MGSDHAHVWLSDSNRAAHGIKYSVNALAEGIGEEYSVA